VCSSDLLAVLVQVVQLVLKQTALLQVVHTKVIIQHVTATLVVAVVNVKLVIRQTVWVHALKILFIQIG
jgi:hypothetical protein